MRRYRGGPSHSASPRNASVATTWNTHARRGPGAMPSTDGHADLISRARGHQAEGDREHHVDDHVLEHGHRQHDAGERRLEDAEVEHDPGDDGDARHRDRQHEDQHEGGVVAGRAQAVARGQERREAEPDEGRAAPRPPA